MNNKPFSNRFKKFLSTNFTATGRKLKRKEEQADIAWDLMMKFGGMGGSLLKPSYGSYYNKQIRQANDIYQPRDRLTYEYRNKLFIDCSILRMVIDKKTKETTRNGIRIKPRFVRKCIKEELPACNNPIHTYEKLKGDTLEPCEFCPESQSFPEEKTKLPLGQKECGEEYQTNQETCTECGFPTRKPNIEHKRKLRKHKRGYVNKAKQTMENVLFQGRLDVEKHDNAIIVAEFFYVIDEVSLKPIRKKLIQIYRADPARIRPVHAVTGDLTSVYYTCILHREIFQLFDIRSLNAEIPKCQNDYGESSCMLPLQPVEYVELETEFENAPIYSYIPGEVFHAKEYNPAGAMGVSIMDSLFFTIVAEIGQEKWIAEYYLRRRMFKGIIQMPQGFAGGSQSESQRKIDSEIAMFRNDPDYIPIFSIPEGSADLKFIRIDDSPKEMEFGDQREENRQIITSAYGMSNVWVGDSSTGGGLNNQGLELTVSTRQVATAQETMNSQVLLPLSASIIDCEIHEPEYFYEYNTPEEQDLMSEKQRYAQDIANMEKLQAMGFEIRQNAENELYASAPIPGMPVLPPDNEGGIAQSLAEAGPRNNYPNSNVEGMNEDGESKEQRAQSLPFSGAPSDPKAEGSELTNKINKKAGNYLEKLYLKLNNGGFIKNEAISCDYFGWLKATLIQIKGAPIKSFKMIRENDSTGISGTGHVANGVVFGDGTTVIRWLSENPSMNIYPSYNDFMEIHVTSHPDNNTEIKMSYDDLYVFDLEKEIKSSNSSAQMIINEPGSTQETHLIGTEGTKLQTGSQNFEAKRKRNNIGRFERKIVKGFEDDHPRAKESITISGKDYAAGAFIPKDVLGEVDEEDEDKIENYKRKDKGKPKKSTEGSQEIMGDTSTEAVFAGISDTGSSLMNNKGEKTEPQNGYGVGAPFDRITSSFPKESMSTELIENEERRIRRALEGIDYPLLIAAWTQNDIFYTDGILLVTDQAEALELGRQLKQLHIWDFEADKVIEL